MTLLREIQDAAADQAVYLPSLLRKCKILAARLKHEEFALWVSRELDGYKSASDVPEYRRIKTYSVGHFAGTFGSGIRNGGIPTSCLPEELHDIAATQVFSESVSALQSLLSKNKSGSMHGKWPPDVVAYAQQNCEIFEGMTLVDAWRVIPPSFIAGILDTVRTRILDFALAIELQDPNAGDVSPGASPSVTHEAVTTIYNTVINGGQAIIGSGDDASIRTRDVRFSTKISMGDQKQIAGLLERMREEAKKLAPRDSAEALEVVEKIEVQLRQPEPSPRRLSSYLALYASIATAAAPTVEILKNLIEVIFGT